MMAGLFEQLADLLFEDPEKGIVDHDSSWVIVLGNVVKEETARRIIRRTLRGLISRLTFYDEWSYR